MKSIFCLVLVAITATAFAQEIQKSAETNEVYVDMITGKKWTPESKFTVEQLKNRDERVLKKTGGLIDVKASGPETFVLDARAKAGAAVAKFCELYTRASKLPVRSAHEALPEGKCPFEVAKARVESEKALMVVIIVECDKLPALSVYPDERVGIVNAKALKVGADPVEPEVRVTKDIWRAVGFIGGFGFNQAKNDLLQPIFTIEDLDEINNAYIQPMSFARMNEFGKKLGVKAPRRVSYRVAVREGWASSPTNDYQKAVWEEEQTNMLKKAVAPIK